MVGDYLANTWRFWKLFGELAQKAHKGLINGSNEHNNEQKTVKELIRCTFAPPFNKEQFKTLQGTKPINLTNSINSINPETGQGTKMGQ